MNIIEALTNVKDSALEGRKLEAWCERDAELVTRFENVLDEEWLWAAYRDGKHLYWFSGLQAEFSPVDIFAVWHVREVEE